MNRFELARAIDGILKPEVRKANHVLDFGDRASFAELQRFRDDSFRNLISHCYQFVPYYKSVMDELGMKPGDVKGLADIVHFPVLTKDIVRAQGNALRIQHLMPGSYVVRRSGGTTGEPIASYVNTFAAALETYSYFRGLQWMGWRPAMSRVLLAGGSLGLKNTSTLRFRLKSWATGIVALPAFELKKANLERYVSAVDSAGDCILTGYASVLKYFSDLCRERSIQPTNIKQVFSTAEVLPEDWRVAIRETLGCPVKSFYGCGEINSLGYQREEGGSYEIPDEHVFVETHADGALLATSLFNFTQPLIRYANGDLGIVKHGDDAHTRSMITELNGRVSDMFTRADGTKLSGSFGPHAVFKGKIQVKKYQFIQQTFTKIEFRYEAISMDITPLEKETLSSMVKIAMGSDADVVFVKTSDFIISKSGKHRIMISNL